MCVFFHEFSQFTREQGNGVISLTPIHQCCPLQKHLSISQVITAESSPRHIGGSQVLTGNFWPGSNAVNVSMK